MTPEQKYRWPSKLRKFGIHDPFLKLLVAKYENEIPWQVTVRDADTLRDFVIARMMPALRKRIMYPIVPGTKHVYLTSRDIDIGKALAGEHAPLESEQRWFIETLREEEGDEVAKEHLATLLNEQKHQGFASWLELVDQQYLDNPAFVVLLLRPILDLSPRGARRVVVSPSRDVVDWLQRRIARGRISPNENLARVYCLKLASGAGRMPRDGWQHVPDGRDHVGQLTGACRGSGWCVESPTWAARYLEHSSFYVLRHRDKPVVALRAEGARIVECQGRSNQSPEGWFVDIDLFLRTQEISLRDRTDQMQSVLSAAGDLQAKPFAWWRDRIRFWPFAIALVPNAMRYALQAEARSAALQYVGFPAFQRLAQRIGLEMSRDDWCEVLAFDPTHYSSCPSPYRETPEVMDACIQGWRELCEDGELTLASLRLIPEKVRKSSEFQSVLEANMPAVKQLTRQRPRSRLERENRFHLADFMSVTHESPPETARELLVNWLLNNEDGDFSVEKLPELIRTRSDFSSIYEEAWRDAVRAQPPYLLAVPEELKCSAGCAPDDTSPGRVDLDSWCDKVQAKPWLLTQKSTVPKTIRWHRRIVDAYRAGWLPYLRQFPWRIWVKRGQGRVYMSYALLTDEIVIDALADGWRQRGSRIHDSWMRGSGRMRNLPAIQLSMLRGIAHRSTTRGWQVSAVANDIKKRLADAPQPGSQTSPMHREIKAILHQLGLE